MMRHLFAATAALLALLWCGIAPSLALCTLCTATVRLDADLATCLVEKAATLSPSLTGSTKLMVVDLKDCASRGALPTGQSAEVKLDKTFAVDADSLKCLLDQVAAIDEAAMSPSHVFDLTRDCPA